MRNIKNSFSVAIIGAGPIGLELAGCLKKKGVDFIQFDKGQIGESVYKYPPQTRFFSSPEKISLYGKAFETPSQEKATREEYLAYLRNYCLDNKLDVHTFEAVTGLKRQNGHFDIQTTKGSYSSKALVFAQGGLTFPRKLKIPGENLAFVYDTLIDPHTFFKSKVLVVGGKNSAAEASLRLFHAGAFVTLVHRKASFDKKAIKYWILSELMGRIKNGQINCFCSAVLEEIREGEATVLQKKKRLILPNDFVVKSIGFEADLSLMHQLKIPFSNKNTPIFSKETMETKVKGAFVMGTVIGGTQNKFEIFIENSHPHVDKVLAGLGRYLNHPQLKKEKTRIEDNFSMLEE
ncbi:NAD(P)-binding domain-containing protein [Criblamydia sequanensis]|uniref:Thioredoxin reductase n=1 Tax=Candidatus Criblamydia sequanensis CRIB-18 TaxID=1437425 RepID=A0A090D109_9BACT|nr:NAD(P)-binding domain-containing protein [Criblamydia sequanensis]CDR33268.1 Putative thioredoxin reductase [Criblamydia sequanensis CRIB-18]